jgi:formamidopyrimidine-DNA glycosylase
MPELPEVETLRRGLERHAVGRRITIVELIHSGVIAGSCRDFAGAVRGGRIDAVERKGKVLAVRFVPSRQRAPLYLVVRLGMTGQFLVMPRAEPLQPHTHLRLVLDNGVREIRYRDARRFGRLRCVSRNELEEILSGLGPDAREITFEQFRQALRNRTAPIKSWLLNQQFLSGVGNIYADESLFAARIHPLTPAGKLSLPAARHLHRAVKRVLDRAVAFQGTTFRDYRDAEGRMGRFWDKLQVYQRTSEPCRRCRRPIRRIVVGGRSTHFCPHCQWRRRSGGTPRRPPAKHGSANRLAR